MSPLSGQAEELERVNIQFKWLHQFQFAGYYAAKEKGFFAEEGLDVNLIERGEGIDAIAEVVDGRAHYGLADGGLLLSRLKGEPVVLVAQIFQNSPVVILALRESGIRTPYDLEGKTVMSYLHGNGDASLKAMVLKTLGDTNLVKWTEHTYRNQDIIDGRADALLAYSTNEPFWFNERNVIVSTIDPRDYGIDFYGDNLFTSEEEARNHPERVEKIRRASLKGWAYALENQQEMVELILSKYNTQKRTRQHLEFEARQTADLINAQQIEIGHFERSRYDKIAEIYKQLSLAGPGEIPAGFFWGNNDKEIIRAELNEEEQLWVQGNTLTVGVEEWPPITFMSKDGRAGGISGSYLDLVAKRTGLKLSFVSGEWDALLKKLREGVIDMVPDAYYTDERTTFGIYTKPYFLSKEFIYVRSGNQDIRSIDDLANKKVAMLKGHGSIPKLRKRFPNMTILELEGGFLSTINAVLNGDADALLEAQITTQQALLDNSITGLKGIDQNVFPANALHFLSRIDDPVLHSILQKGLDTISDDEHRLIRNKWLDLGNDKDVQKIDLTLDEQQWLAEHQNIRIGDDFSLPPFSFLDEQGTFSGIAADYLDETSKRLGMKMTPVTGLSWEQVLKGVKSGEVDLLPAIVRTAEREDYLNFTKPIISFPIVVATRKDGPFVDNPSDLKGFKTGVVAGYVTEETLARDFPNLNLVPFKNLEAGLIALQDNQLDAFVDNLGSMTYLIEKENLADIKIAAPTDYKFELSIGVRKDWPELVPILDKAIDSLSVREKTAIKNAWMAVQVDFGLDTVTILIWIAPIAAGIIVFFAVVVVWNRKLGLQVEERLEAETRTRMLLESVGEGIFGVDNEGHVTFVNSLAAKSLGYTQNELVGQKVHALIHHTRPDGTDYPIEECPMWAAYTRGTAARVSNELLWRKDGTSFPVEYNATPLWRQDIILGAVISFRDVTEAVKVRQMETEHLAELERFNELAIERELRMIELKQEINDLLQEKGLETKYEIVQ